MRSLAPTRIVEAYTLTDVRLLLEDDNVMKVVVLRQCYKVEFPLEYDVNSEVEE